jgi:hypothetical protein
MMIWYKLDIVDKIRLGLLSLFVVALLTLKGGGIIILSYLWVFMPLLVFSVLYVLVSIAETGWDKIARFVGDD